MRDRDGKGVRSQLRSTLLQWVPIAFLRYNAKIISAIWRVHGFREGKAFLDQLGGIFRNMGARYGPQLGSLVLCVAGSFHGCRFCGVSHLYAANVDYFHTTGKLFPLDEFEIIDLHKLPFDDFRQLILQRLAGPEFVEERRVIERIFALRMGEAAETEEDRVLNGVLDAWNALGECTIEFGYDANPAEIPPLLLKPTPMKEIRRYRAARETQRKRAVL